MMTFSVRNGFYRQAAVSNENEVETILTPKKLPPGKIWPTKVHRYCA